MKTFYWYTATAIFMLLVVVAFYKAQPLLFPAAAVDVPLNPECILREGGCRSLLPQGGAVVFEITPHDIPVVQPLQYDVRIDGLKALAVEVDFSGVDMNMGFNRTRLEKFESGRYTGGGMLPVCARTRMDWEAKILIETAEGMVVVPYRFATYKPGFGAATTR